MRPIKTSKWFVFAVFLILGLFGVRSWTSGTAGAKSASLDPGPPQAYLPLILKSNPAPTATSTPIPTSTPNARGCILAHYGAYEQQLYDLINNERAKAGLAALTPNNSLETSAGWHSDDMALNNFISHTGSDGSSFWDRALAAGYSGSWGGEIIMYSNSPAAAMAWWMGDAPHRDMILSNTNDFGAGYAYCSGKSYGYYTVDFGHR